MVMDEVENPSREKLDSNIKIARIFSTQQE
jgi:hypothetical protein